MNCWTPVQKLLREAPSTTPELAAECGVSIRTMNARMQFYRLRGLVAHNGRVMPKNGKCGQRVKFWELVTRPRPKVSPPPSYVVLTPQGQPLEYTRAAHRPQSAIRLFAPRMPGLWRYAETLGYRVADWRR